MRAYEKAADRLLVAVVTKSDHPDWPAIKALWWALPSTTGLSIEEKTLAMNWLADQLGG